MISFIFKKFKKPYRGVEKSVIVLVILAVIFISSIAIYYVENQPKVPNQSLAYISVTPSNTVPKISPDILTCSSCSKNITFSFKVTSTLIKKTTVTLEYVSLSENGNVVKTYSSKDFQVSYNNTVQNKPLEIYKSVPSLLSVNVGTGSDSWQFGTYQIELNLKFGSPFNSNQTYTLTPETFTLVNSYPSNIQYFLPIYIHNTQKVATDAPFQQMVKINTNDYYSYEANDLSNVEFFNNNGTVLSSWLENGNSNTGESTYWVSLPDGIPANSTAVIFLGFANKSVNLFNNITVGEAPQLSPIYGQYDNIGHIMNPGLLWQVYYSKNATLVDSNNNQAQLYTATMTNGTKLAYDQGQFNTTLNPMATSLNGSVILGHYAIFANELSSTGSPLPNINSSIIPNTSHSFAIKAVGWEDVNVSTVFVTTADDGVAISMGTRGPAFNGTDFLGGTTPPNNRLNAWHQESATEYTFFSPRGTQRLEVDYYNWGGAWYFYFGAFNIANYYHPALPPNNVVPTSVLGIFSQV